MRCRSAVDRALSALACSLTAAAFGIFALLPGPSALAQPAPRTAPQAARMAVLANLRPHPNASQPAVAAPVLSLAQGSYSGPQTVTVTDATPGAVIYYSANGSLPTTLYSGPIAISRSCTVVVQATLSGYTSNTAFAAYYIASVPDSFLYNVAGTSYAGYAGDGGSAKQAILNYPSGTAENSSGDVYIADTDNNVVRKVDASTGIITTVVGTGIAGYSGDGGQAASAQLFYPEALAIDSAGNLYIDDSYNGVIRKVTMSTGIISTYAGDPQATALGDGGPATGAGIANPTAIAIDSSGNLYILCVGGVCGHDLVREVDATTQIITTVAGGGSGSYPNTGGPATSVELPDPLGIAVDAAANIYITDGFDAIWEVTRSTGNIGTFAGTYDSYGYSGDGGPAIDAKLGSPWSIAVDSHGNVYFSDQFSVIREVAAATGVISTVAGNGNECAAFVEDGGAALSSEICSVQGLSLDGAGNLYFGDDSSGVEELTATGTPPSTATANPTFSLSSGSYSSPQTLGLSDSTANASIYFSIVTNPPASYDAGNLLVMPGDGGYHGPISLSGSAILAAQAVAPGHTPSNIVTSAYTYTLPPTSVVSTIAGSGTGGFAGAGGPATAAEMGLPNGIAMDSSGNLFIADENDEVIWKVDTSGIISIVAGTGESGGTGDNGPATEATFYNPSAVVVDRNGNIFIADPGDSAVREVLATNGNIVLYAGNGLPAGNSEGGGPATSTYIGGPSALALDSNSNLYIASSLDLVYEVNASTGIIQIVAGNGLLSGLGDGGPATSASLIDPQGLALDTAGNLYIADYGHYLVREVNAKTGIIGTVAGNGLDGFSGDGQLATDAEVSPNGIAVDGNGNIFISNGDEIRKVDAKTGTISSTAGIDYYGTSFDGGAASMATVCASSGILLDAQSNLLYTDLCTRGVRKITFNVPAPAPTFNPPAGAYTSAQSVTISDAAPNAAIYYTTDGSTPTTSSTPYSAAIAVGKSETVNAIAVASGYPQSAAGSAAYTFLYTPAIALSSSANPADQSQAITFSAKLSSSVATPTGSVAFYSGTTQLGSGTLSSGTATYTASALASGSYGITAQYSGDANFASVTSASLTQTVTSFSIGVPSGGSTTSTVSPGGTATYTLSVTPPGNNAVSFSISGLPTGATSSFSPSSVAAGAPDTTVKLSVTVPSQSAAVVPDLPGRPSRMPLAFGLLLLPLIGVRRLRKSQRFLFVLLLGIAGVSGLAVLNGCGGGSNSSSSGGSQQQQSYTLTVTATAGSQTQSTTLTLNVQ